MTAYYFDASAAAKLYLPEPGSQWVTDLLQARTMAGDWEHAIHLTRIGVVEVAAAIARRRRMGLLPPDQQARLYQRFLADSRQRFDLLHLDDPTFDLAADLTQCHPLRGYDAMHLAAALRLRAFLVAAGLSAPVFVCADANLCAVARAEGLNAENPNDHP